MKRSIQTTFAVLAMMLTLSACNINEDYDLGNIDGGDLVLGDETSTFSIPLATVSVDIETLFKNIQAVGYGGSELVTIGSKVESLDDIKDFDADEIVKLLNALLPSQMPAGSENGLDLAYLDKESYITPIIQALVDELTVSNSKRLILADAILYNLQLDDNARESIIVDHLGYEDSNDIYDYTAQEIADDLGEYLNDEQTDEQELVDTIVNAILSQNFSTLTDGFNGEISENDTKIDTSVIDALTQKIDETDDFEITFYYTIATNLTFSFELEVTLINTSTNARYTIGEKDNDLLTITDEDEFASLLENLKIEYSIQSKTYSPSTGGLTGKFFNLKLMATKKGALIL